MSDWDEDDKNAPLPPPMGLSLGHDGKIDGIHRPPDQRRSAESSRRPAEEPPLELAPRIIEAAPVLEPEPVSPRSNRHLFTLITLMVLISASGLAIYFHQPVLGALEWLKDSLLPGEPPALPPPPALPTAVNENGANALPGGFALTIMSTPPGAEIVINHEPLGVTPFIGSHGFSSGERGMVELTLPGYKPWAATIQGGKNVKLDIALIPKKSR